MMTICISNLVLPNKLKRRTGDLSIHGRALMGQKLRRDRPNCGLNFRLRQIGFYGTLFVNLAFYIAEWFTLILKIPVTSGIKKCLFALVLCLAGFVNANCQSLDVRLLEHFNGPPSGADGTWRNVSKSVYAAMAITPVSMLVTGLVSDNKELTAKALETGASILIAQGFTAGLKATINRQRPYLKYPDLITGKSNSTGHSFPSGHASGAFAVATSLSLSFPKWYVIAPSFAYAGAVGYSRMYLGVHYPSDVFAGALVGAGSSFLTWKLQKLINKKSHGHYIGQ
jgi:membrane-associated phospholipid phosphatase